MAPKARGTRGGHPDTPVTAPHRSTRASALLVAGEHYKCADNGLAKATRDLGSAKKVTADTVRAAEKAAASNKALQSGVEATQKSGRLAIATIRAKTYDLKFSHATAGAKRKPEEVPSQRVRRAACAVQMAQEQMER